MQWHVLCIHHDTLVAALTKFDSIFLSTWQPARPTLDPSLDPDPSVRLAQARYIPIHDGYIPIHARYMSIRNDTHQYTYDTHAIHANTQRYTPIHIRYTQYTYDTHNTRIVHVSLCIGMYRACIVVCTGKMVDRHFATKQKKKMVGEEAQQTGGSDSDSSSSEAEEEEEEEEEPQSEEGTDEGVPVEEEGTEAAGESLKTQAIEEFANSTNGAFKVSGNTGKTLTLALQDLMGRKSLTYFNSRECVGKLLAHSAGPESPWGGGPTLVTKNNLKARLHAFEPRYVIAIRSDTSQYVVILIGIHTNTSGYIRQIIDTPSIHDGYLYDT